MSRTKTSAGTRLSASDYRYESISFKLFLDDLRFSEKSVKPGQTIPNIDVFNTNGEQLKLYDLSKDQPLLLITGSLTCPMTISSIPSVGDFQNEMGDAVNIALVYVREAHPGEKVPQPMSLDEKIDHAKRLREVYGTDFPIIVDGIDGELHQALDIMPNSAHLIDSEGILLFRSLFATDKAAIEKALTAVSKGKRIQKTESQGLVAPMVGAAGYMNGTFTIAGRRSHKEMLVSALPVYLWSLTSSLYFFLPENKRGAFGLITIIGAIAVGAWALFAN